MDTEDTAIVADEMSHKACVDKCMQDAEARKKRRATLRGSQVAERKAAEAKAKDEIRAWQEEIKKEKKAAKADKAAIRESIRKRFENASIEELSFDVQKAAEANEDFAVEALQELLDEKALGGMEEVVNDEVEIGRLRALIANAPPGEEGSEVVEKAVNDLADMGVTIDAEEVKISREQAIFEGKDVPPANKEDLIKQDYETYGKYNKGGRRRKTRRGKKGRRKTKGRV